MRKIAKEKGARAETIAEVVEEEPVSLKKKTGKGVSARKEETMGKKRAG